MMLLKLKLATQNEYTDMAYGICKGYRVYEMYSLNVP